MHTESEIVMQVYAAKEDMMKAEDLISAYIPFIKKEASKTMAKICTEQDDEFSIALMGFHEAICGYTKERGAFLSYAALIIRSRLIDFLRKEFRHLGHASIYEVKDEDDTPLVDLLVDEKDYFEESVNLDATKKEIEELSRVMSDFGINMSDVADHSPKQKRTLDACGHVVRYAAKHTEILDELLLTKKLPMKKLIDGTGVEKKTLERHRKYVLAMLLIQTNGYEIVRGHLKHVLTVRGGA